MERLRARQTHTQGVERFTRHAAASIGEIAQMIGDIGRPIELRELYVQRRHCGQSRHLFSGDGVDHVAWQQVVEQDHPCATVKRGRELTESGVERER